MARSPTRPTAPTSDRLIAWTFDDGPTAGTTYQHRLGADGSVAYRSGTRGRFSDARKARVERVGTGVLVVAYESKEGYALTAVLDEREGEVLAFASGKGVWAAQHGRFWDVAARPRPSRPGHKPVGRARRTTTRATPGASA